MQFRLNRRTLIRQTGFLSTAGLVPLQTGCGRDQSAPHDVKFRVTGNSMAPTFVGTHAELRCQRCRITIRITLGPISNDSAATKNAASVATEATSWTCWHCGHANESPAPAVRQGDVVEISRITPTSQPHENERTEISELALGDVVAVSWQNRTRLKRLAGLPGDTITADGPWLYNNQVPIHHRFPSQQQVTIPVDVDTFRSTSRWRTAPTLDHSAGSSTSSTTGWMRHQNQWGSPAQTRTETPWLVYHHINVHDQDKASPVYDDWPSNIDLARRLFPARDLQVSLTIVGPRPCTIETAIWSPAGVWRQTTQTDTLGQFDLLRHASGRGAAVMTEPDESVPVSATAPIAIRVIDGPCRISGLRVDRFVEYRLRSSDDLGAYPRKIGDGQCFVVGDNVPVSIDSRSVGLIPAKQIRGLIRGLAITQ